MASSPSIFNSLGCDIASYSMLIQQIREGTLLAAPSLLLSVKSEHAMLLKNKNNLSKTARVNIC